MAPRICGVYRTVSYETVMVVADVVPIYLLSEGKSEKELSKTGKKNGTVLLKLIKNIKPWVEKKVGHS